MILYLKNEKRYYKNGGLIRKMQTGSPIHYSRTMTSNNLSKAANYVGEYVLKGLGAFGKIMTAPFVQQGPTSATIYKSKKLLEKEKAIELKSEEQLGKAMTWVSPLNYGAALATGNGLNARKGEEKVDSWSPAWQAIGRAAELYASPKVVKKFIPKKTNGLINNLEQYALRDNTRSNSRITVSDVYKSLAEAKEYKSSKGYRELVHRAQKEAEEMGLPFNSDLYTETNNHLPSVKLNSRPEGKLGGYRRSTNTIELDPDLLSPLEGKYVPFHEGLHWLRVGAPEMNSPLYNRWKEDMYNDLAWKEFYDSKEYENLALEDNAKAYARKKVKEALYEGADPYLSVPGELLANGLEAGRAIGLEPFAEYPGDGKALEAIIKARNYNSYLLDIKYERTLDKLNFWKILTGNYLPAVSIPLATGYNIFSLPQQQLQYLKQRSKMNVIELFKDGGQIRKMLIAAGGSLQLTTEELKYYSWMNMSPELRRQNRNNRVKAYLSSAPSIGNFWEALLTYIGNRDPENPYLNTGEAPNTSKAMNPKLVVQAVLKAGKVVDKAKRYITLTKESTKMLNYPKIGQRYSKSKDIMSDFNPISDLLHLRLPDFTHSSLGLGNKYRAIGGRKALKNIIENGVVAPKGLFSREGKVFWNDGYLDRTYSRRGIFALSYDKTGKVPFYSGSKANSNYVYSSHENPIDFYDEALGLHARIPFTSTYVEIPKTLEGIDKALKMDKIHRYVEKPIHKLYNWGLKPYLGYKLWEHFENEGENKR